MDESKNRNWLVLELEGRRFALPLQLVERVVRAVEIIRLPHALSALHGVINVQGRIVPVLNTYAYFDLPSREITPSDFLLLLHIAERSVALLANRVLEVVSEQALESTNEISTSSDGIRVWKNEVVFLVEASSLAQVLEQSFSINDLALAAAGTESATGAVL